MIAHEVHLSIGILAHNEESRIAKSLRALFTQDVFQKFRTEVVIVVNGCTDETAAVARKSLADHHALWSAHGTARVEELATAGKANAWNQFVHELSSPQAPVLVLMDADITLLTTHSISSMICTLESSPDAVVCVDRPVKDIEINTSRSFLQRLLVAATPQIDPNYLPLCGQLYCVQSAEARLIRLPVEITCEDGFLRALIITHGFTRPENPGRITLDSNTEHMFASVASFKELFKHEVWIVAGSIVNVLLYTRFWAECTPNCNAMALMEAWQQQDPQWLPRYIESQVEEKGWGLLPRPWWTRRWSRLAKLPLQRKLIRLPITVIAAAMDILIFIAAIRQVRRAQAFRYWGRQ